ncbi:NAD-dependent epimerase/dehydratase family protein [Micrococcus lylae]|uniref:NAD-dependent epimerase/dehydratase family protein n=1 Tax=Micrococcus lylae TaxID=1273 RepID=UPI003EBE1C12
MSTILITGGAGFIGQYVARSLNDRGHRVLAMDTLEAQVHSDPEAASERFPGEVLRHDVSAPDSWEGLGEVDGVVHLAAETGTAQSMYEQDRYRRTNVEGTRQAAEFCAARDIPLVSLSSRAVYGEGLLEQTERESTDGRDYGVTGRYRPSSEDDAHEPVSVYGETKSEAEEIAKGVLAAGRLAVLRPQNVVGLGQALHNPYTGVLAAFLSRLKAGMPLSVYGDGTQTRDFVHVSDVAAAIVWALEASKPGEPLVVNVGTGIRLTLDELAETARGASKGEEVAIEHVDVHRAGDIDHACADMTHAWGLGMPRPRLTPQEAIVDFIANSWDMEAADPRLWDKALSELTERGLAES